MDVRFWLAATTACTVRRWNSDTRHEPWSKLYMLGDGTASYAVAAAGGRPVAIRLRPGRIYLIPGGRRHINACNAGFTLHWCHFTVHDDGLARRIAAMDRILDLPAADCGATPVLVAGACRDTSAGLRAAALVLRLLGELPSPADDPLAAVRRRIAPALAEIEYRFAHPLSISQLAALCDLRPSRFHQLFREVMGMPAHAYQVQLRLAEAQRLLRAGGLSVHEVAERCGYASQFTFSRIFTNHCGLPPSRFAGKQSMHA
jgi:AraC-like DNA-binding protein